jgi:hypothetical protein
MRLTSKVPIPTPPVSIRDFQGLVTGGTHSGAPLGPYSEALKSAVRTGKPYGLGLYRYDTG